MLYYYCSLFCRGCKNSYFAIFFTFSCNIGSQQKICWYRKSHNFWTTPKLRLTKLHAVLFAGKGLGGKTEDNTVEGESQVLRTLYIKSGVPNSSHMAGQINFFWMFKSKTYKLVHIQRMSSWKKLAKKPKFWASRDRLKASASHIWNFGPYGVHVCIK